MKGYEMNWIKKLFSPKKVRSSGEKEGNEVFHPEPITAESISRKLVHSTKNNTWGNAINFTEWKPNEMGFRKVYGHMQSLSVGDWFAVELKSGKVGILEITKLEWQSDPADMFFGEAADVGFVPDGVALTHKPVEPMFRPLGMI